MAMASLPVYSLLLRISALLLLVAGIQKWSAFLFTWDSPESWLPYLAFFEMGLALWSLVARANRYNGWVLLATYGVFFLTSLGRAGRGELSCSCFGDWSISPWFAATIDAAIVLGLAATLPRHDPSFRSSPNRWLAFSLGILGLVGILLFTAIRYRPSLSELAELEQLRRSPSTWVGEPLSLLPYIDIGSQLRSGTWIVMVYRWNCGECQRALPLYAGLAHALSIQEHGVRIALVEAPPFDVDHPLEGRSYLRGRLTGTRRWALRTPLFLRLTNGVVQVSTTSEEPLLTDPLGSHAPPVENAGGTIFPNYRELNRRMYLQEIACGPLSLVAILQELGFFLTPAQTDELMDAAGDKGMDMLALKKLAEGFGLHALGVSATVEQLRALDQCAIVHLEQVGFAAALGYEKEGVRLVYPLQPQGLVPYDLFERSFGKPGKALLLAREPLNPRRLGLAGPSHEALPRQGPILNLSRSILAAGRRHQWTWEAGIDLKNDGTDPLQVEIVKCPGCTVEALPGAILPGQSAPLVVRGKEPIVGGFSYRLKMLTNQPNAREVAVPIRGYLEHPVTFEPPAVFIRGSKPGQAREAVVSAFLARGLEASDLTIDIPAQAPLEAKLEKGLDGVHVLKIRWLGAMQPGTYRYQLLFALMKPDAIAAPFHLAIEVLPSDQVSPIDTGDQE